MTSVPPSPQLRAVRPGEVDEREIAAALTDDRLRCVLLLRCGFGHTKQHPYKETADSLSVTEARAKQLEKIALAKIRVHREQERGLRSS